MNIQLGRYKERFKIDFQIDEELYNYCIVKLVIQPILENAIYYGVGHMDEDDDGRIVVSGEKKDNDIYISIEDNGMGMREEVVENIPLTSIVLETDCPYMAPEPNRGKRNNSAYIRYVAEKIAELKGITYEEVVEQTEKNARDMYRL